MFYTESQRETAKFLICPKPPRWEEGILPRQCWTFIILLHQDWIVKVINNPFDVLRKENNDFHALKNSFFPEECQLLRPDEESVFKTVVY